MNRSSEPVQWAAQALLQGLNLRQTALANGPGCQPDAGQPVRQLLSAGLQSHQGAARAASGVQLLRFSPRTLPSDLP